MMYNYFNLFLVKKLKIKTKEHEVRHMDVFLNNTSKRLRNVTSSMHIVFNSGINELF